MKRMLSLLIASLIIGAGVVSPARAADFYVATNGYDVNPGTKAKPFATLERARNAIREMKSRDTVTVFVRGGLYALPRTLKLDAADGGTVEAPVLWRAYGNEKPVLIGGRPISGFVPWKNGIFKTDVGTQGFTNHFRQLFFDGRRQHLARYPNYDPQNPYGGGWAYADGEPWPMYKARPGEDNHTLQYKPADARQWARPEEAEVFIFPRYNWWNNIIHIKSVDRDLRIITLAGNCSYPIRSYDRYYVQGVLEELDAPGEWYLDKKEKALYFWPPKPFKGRVVCAPTMRTILELGPGTANVSFRGLTFECCDGTAIVLNRTTNCVIAASVIRNVGDYDGSGVSINGGKNNGVVGCDIYEVGRDAIVLDGGDRKTLAPAGNYADNNYLHHTGVFYKQGLGVSIRGVGQRVSHNLIHDCPRFGIDFEGNDHIVEYNHIRHVDIETEDSGGIYTWNVNWAKRGTEIRYNYFHDVLGYGHDDQKGIWRSPHFAWGIYLDDGTCGTRVYGNMVARAPFGGGHIHGGRDNLIENNIFVDGDSRQMTYSGYVPQLHPIPMITTNSQPFLANPVYVEKYPALARFDLETAYQMAGNKFLRNIICYHKPDAKLYLFYHLPFEQTESDYNLVYHFGLPLLTGVVKAKELPGPNMVPNPGFEEGEPGKLPARWHWSVRPNDSKAAVDADVKFSGQHSLRIEGRGTTTDSSHQVLWPNFLSTDISARTGHWYRLVARLKAAEPDTKFSMMAQSYIPKAYFWCKAKDGTLDTEWKEYELVFKHPAPGDPDYKPQMNNLFCVRMDVRQPKGTIWVDDVSLREAEPLGEWESWRTMGLDQHSLVADPLFVNPRKDDYRLRSDSPAFKLGFKPIPVEKIGPYRDPLRARWPIREAEGVREHPLPAEMVVK